MIRNSLTFRLFVTSAAWVALTLVVVAILLTLMFQKHVEQHFDAFLFDHMEENIAAGKIDEEGLFYMSWVPADLRFNKPLSGWYWQVNDGTQVIATSSSLTNNLLKFQLPGLEGGNQLQKIIGPNGEKLRVLVMDAPVSPDSVSPDSQKRFTFTIAGSVSSIAIDVEDFTTDLGITLILLGLGLITAVLLQIRFGLKPLRLLKEALQDVRSGKKSRLPENFPDEVQPTVVELNSMMNHSEALMQRSRAQLGDLAHALKNPLSVIKNEAKTIPGESGVLLQEKADAMGAYVERYLSRARAAGTGNIIGASADVWTVAEDIRYLMEHVYQDKELKIELSGLNKLHFKGDAQDLEEMLGNLMDNACKWTKDTVSVRGKSSGLKIILTVEDNGPGIPEHECKTVLQRGTRLDETVPGSGLGLGIVFDLVNLYEGSLALEKSPEGGLRAVLELPAASL